MDGYPRAAKRESMARRTPRQVKRHEILNALINGPAIYLFALIFYGFWGWVVFESLGR